LNRAFDQRGLVVLPCARKACIKPNSAQPFSRLRFQIFPVNSLGFGGSVCFQQHCAERLTRRIVKLGGLLCNQCVFEPHRAFEVRDRLVIILSGRANVSARTSLAMESTMRPVFGENSG